MCGIVGYYSSEIYISEDEFLNIVNSLRHRGPDNQSIYQEHNMGIGHTRLSIIDLSPMAHQPMFSKNERYAIVFNGEIYNYKEIASKYKVQTRTNSDTEVILETFAIKGLDVVKEFNGMFSIAIYDKKNSTFTFFRDRVGKKPLYYYQDHSFFAFASEIKALLNFPYIKDKLLLNDNSINYYLHLGFIPEPYTIYKNIYKFPAASVGVFSANELKIFPFWNIEEHISETYISDENYAKEQLKFLINSSVKYRLVSDVPYGVFLSGGIDSSLITAIAQNVTGNIKTYSIGFHEAKYNEASYAKAIAKYLNTKHTEYIVSYNDALSLLDSFIEQYDEPFADASAIPTMLVSKLAKGEVSMVLSGDGGDELFWGYGAYRWAKRLHKPGINIIRNPLFFLLSRGSSRYKRVAQMFKYSKTDFIPAHIHSQEQYFFRTNEIKDLCRKSSFIENNFFTLLPTKRKLKVEEVQSLFDFKYYLKDDLMVKVDRASMKYALEVRSPLLDYRIIELAYNLNPKLKHRNNIDKYLLKQVLYEYIPKSLLERPKWGFALPLNCWLKKELKTQIKETFNTTLSHQYMFDKHFIGNLMTKYEFGHDYLYGRIWNLYVLFKWFEKNKFT